MLTALIVLQVIVCILLVVVVLLQFGKGAEIGAVMGGGASQAVFSGSTKGNFFSKFTTVLAITFLVNSIALTNIKSKEAKKSLFDDETSASPLNSDTPKDKNENASSEAYQLSPKEKSNETPSELKNSEKQPSPPTSQ